MCRSSVVLRTTILFLSIAAMSRGQSLTYEKYELPNGMTVILHQDDSLPVACINTWYYVGSKDEKARRSGFAHLFEHLMFMGTERVPGNEFDTRMEAGGGWNNASTSQDRTNYFSMGPSELLPTLLWLDADRLEALGENMTQEKLDKQRDVVRNERRQSYENRPYGNAELRIQGLMYPKGHPYHIPVIGTHEDLEAATVKDVKDFFAEYYVPSNASLVVAGQFDSAVIKPLVAELFGTLPRGNDVVHAAADPVRLSRVIRHTETDDVQFEKVYMAYHSPAMFAPGDAEMDLIGEILASGVSSRLYQALVYENDLAVDVSAYQMSSLLGSVFLIEATAKPGVELARIEQGIDDVIVRLQKDGPDAEELKRQQAQFEFAMVSRLQSVLAKADLLNRYEFHFGEPDSLERDLNRYRSATQESIRDWARSVLTPSARLIMHVVPELDTPEANPRDAEPMPASAGEFVVPSPNEFALSNGIRVYHWQRDELPLVQVSAMMPYGTISDPPSAGGLTSLAVDMLDEGAGDLGAIEFANALDQLGASFGAGADLETTTADLSVLSHNFDEALSLYADALRRPRLDEKEWERVHRLHLERLKQLLDRPTYVAAACSMRQFFGDGHPYSRPRLGTEETSKQVSLGDVRSHLARLVAPENVTLLIAGDISREKAQRSLEGALGKWKSAASGPPLETPPVSVPATRGFRVAIVDKPGAVQTVIRFTMPGAPYADPRRTKADLVNTILGGSFTSRLNQNLREDKGYTYGARSNFSWEPSGGYLTASSSVVAEATGASVREFLAEFNKLRSGTISDEEVRKARKSNRSDRVESFQGLGGVLGVATTLLRNGLPFSALGDELSQIAAADRDELNELAKTMVQTDRALLVLVGDRGLIEEQIGELNLPQPTIYDVSGSEIE